MWGMYADANTDAITARLGINVMQLHDARNKKLSDGRPSYAMQISALLGNSPIGRTETLMSMGASERAKVGTKLKPKPKPEPATEPVTELEIEG